ncbi:MAG: FAD-dependent oxidoreductase [Beijerinckiaceae bacterium]
MPKAVAEPAARYATRFDVVVIGAGAAGLVAALRAHEAGADVLVIERDALPRGSTALSAGLIPAAGTRFQRAAGIEDAPAALAADIMRKAKDAPDLAAVALLAGTIGPAIEWLADKHGLPFSVIDNFTYPGHSAKRMHGLPTRSGGELMDQLSAAVERVGIMMLTRAVAETLIHDGAGRMTGVGIQRPDGGRETVGCGALVLACNGYGGNPALVARHLPEMAGALYFGHAGNQGDALLWGQTLGAATRHLSGYQGHGSVAEPHGILITWATITEGGFQVNALGRRFHNEATGYSEAAAAVAAQPGGAAWQVFDGRIAAIARQFEDFRNAAAQGALLSGPDMEWLARRMQVDPTAFLATAQDVTELKRTGGVDTFGRSWAGAHDLAPPFHAVKVRGALFHTQGGLVVDSEARVVGKDGRPFVNLFAAGGAASGVSGPDASGYLSGNGLLTAVAYGFIAGKAATAVA